MTARISRVLAVPAHGGFFADDQAAIRAGAPREGFTYAGAPRTPGFTAIRQPAEALSVLLVLEDGQVAHGDCVAVQYAGAGGRDPVFSASEAAGLLERVVAPLLAGRSLTSFRDLAGELDDICVEGRRLHSALRYGLSQAVLDAVARATGVTMAEVVRAEYDTGVDLRAVGLFAQCGDERYANVDKMILRRAAALPHGLVNSVADRVGWRGEILMWPWRAAMGGGPARVRAVGS